MSMINDKKTSVIIMAAGKGTRLGGQIPKPLTTIKNQSILVKIINTVSKLKIENIIIVIGYKSKDVEDHVKKNLNHLSNILFAIQEILDGTLGAVVSGMNKISNNTDLVLVLPADNGWFLKPQTLERLIKTHTSTKAMVSLLLTREFNEGLHKVGYLTDKKRVLGVRPVNKEEIGEYGHLSGTGIICLNKYYFENNKHLIPQLPNGEYAVSRIIEVAINQFKNVSFEIVDKDEILTINTPEDLEYLKKSV